MSSTQFQGHLLESRKLTNNSVGQVCGSGAWVDLHECIYTYRGTSALVERYFLLKEFFFSIIYSTISYEIFKDLHTSLIYLSLSCIGEEMATHSSVLAWRIPGTEEPGGLQSMGLHRVGHD